MSSRLALRLRAHVDQLASEHMLNVTYLEGASPRAQRRERRVWLRPVRGRSTYYTALHEIGHVVGVNARRRLEQEVLAWQWALDHAIVPPTPGVWAHIARCLEGYVERAERWASMKLPPADHDFWLLLERAREGRRA